LASVPGTGESDLLGTHARKLMLGISLEALARPIERVLAIGCHADDIEIGCARGR
jgi:hypothetical protein